MSALLSLEPEALAHALQARPEGLLLLFSAQWCGPCKTYKPIVERVVAELEGAELLVVDCETSAAVATEFGVRAVPTLLCFRHGELVAQQTGAMLEPRLRSMLRDLGLRS